MTITNVSVLIKDVSRDMIFNTSARKKILHCFIFKFEYIEIVIGKVGKLISNLRVQFKMSIEISFQIKSFMRSNEIGLLAVDKKKPSFVIVKIVEMEKKMKTFLWLIRMVCLLDLNSGIFNKIYE